MAMATAMPRLPPSRRIRSACSPVGMQPRRNSLGSGRLVAFGGYNSSSLGVMHEKMLEITLNKRNNEVVSWEEMEESHFQYFLRRIWEPEPKSFS